MNQIIDSLDEITKMRLLTLQNAEEISPFVTERTIGPDCKNCEQKDKTELAATVPDNISNEQKVPHENEMAESFCDAAEPQPLCSVLLSNEDIDAMSANMLLREAELERRRNVRKQVIKYNNKLTELRRRSAENVKPSEAEKSTIAKRRSDNDILQEAEKFTAEQIKESEKVINELRNQTQRKLQILSFQGVSLYVNKFRVKYETVAKLLVSIDRKSIFSCEEYNKNLKDLIQTFEQLLNKLKTLNIGPAELKSADAMCKDLDKLEQKIIQELSAIVSNERKQMEEAAKTAQAVVEKPKEEIKVQPAQNVQQTITAEKTMEENSSVPNAQPKNAEFAQPKNAESVVRVSAERLQMYNHINSLYQQKLEKVKPLQADENYAKYRMQCKRAIVFPLNAISAASAEHLHDKFNKLYNFFNGQPSKTPQGDICINDHPLGQDFSVLLMAKHFVSQADTVISSDPKAAYPFASVIVSLWKLLPDFGNMFLAYIFKNAPLLVPYYTEAQSQQQVCLKQQSGIARLYAAVMITNGRQVDGSTHPYSIDNAWRWITNFMMLEPLPEISATLLEEMLQILGPDMLANYGKQFVKLLFYIRHTYFIKLDAIDEGGPKVRLEQLLNKFLKEGQMKKPEGTLPFGFW